MNEFYISIVGASPIIGKLDEDKEFAIAFKELGLVSMSKKPLENGHFAYTYKLKNLDEVTVIQEDKVVKGKEKDTTAKKLRGALYYQYVEDGGEDFESWYESKKKQIPALADKIYQWLK